MRAKGVELSSYTVSLKIHRQLIYIDIILYLTMGLWMGRLTLRSQAMIVLLKAFVD